MTIGATVTTAAIRTESAGDGIRRGGPRLRYNSCMMNRILASVWLVALALAIVALPSVGPMIDHHFAERQPYHAHFRTDVAHAHDYANQHAHGDDPAESGDDALFGFDALSGGPALALITDSRLMGRLAADSASLLAIPGIAETALASTSVPPPEKPPRA